MYDGAHAWGMLLWVRAAWASVCIQMNNAGLFNVARWHRLEKNTSIFFFYLKDGKTSFSHNRELEYVQ
jgi:hypothetical protein